MIKNSAMAIILNKQGKFLLLQRDETAPVFANKWTLFSGRIEEGENPKQAIIRELKEELGVKVKKLEYLKAYKKSVPGYNLKNLKRHALVIKLTLKQPIKVNEGKCAKYFSKSELKKLDMANYTRKALNDFIEAKL